MVLDLADANFIVARSKLHAGVSHTRHVICLAAFRDRMQNNIQKAKACQQAALWNAPGLSGKDRHDSGHGPRYSHWDSVTRPVHRFRGESVSKPTEG